MENMDFLLASGPFFAVVLSAASPVPSFVFFLPSSTMILIGIPDFAILVLIFFHLFSPTTISSIQSALELV